MRVLIAITAATVLSGCITDVNDIQNLNPFTDNTPHTEIMVAADPYIGFDERTHREELKELLEVDPVKVEWCAAFVNSILEAVHVENLYDTGHPAPLMARSFLGWGEKVNPSNIKPGDIVIFPRGRNQWQGHVGFYVDTHEDGRWVILGGNQDKSVSYKLFNPRHAIGVRRRSS